MAVKDYYKILGLSEKATPAEIKKKYRKLVRKYHPDKNPGDKQAEEKFKAINEAHDVISDPEKRKKYDLIRQYGSRFNFGGSGQESRGGMSYEDILKNFNSGKRRKSYRNSGDSFQDIFSQFFDLGDFSSSETHAPQRGKNILSSITIPFETAIKGGNQFLKLETESICERCNGIGSEPGSKTKTCSQCKGKGTISVNQGPFATSYVCPTCQGKGQIIETLCKKCNGAGKVATLKTIKVKIPRGIENNSKIRLKGKGALGINGGPSGDLIIKIFVQTHSTFKRNGLNLEVEISITLIDALLGTEINVPTMDGMIKMKIPSGTQPNSKLRIKGKGVPSSGSRGDLIIKVLVKFPKKLTEEQKELIKKLKETGL